MAVVLTVVSVMGFGLALEDASRHPLGEPASAPDAVTLGAVHTESALLHHYDTAEELRASRLKAPGLAVLMSAMDQDPRMRLTVESALLVDMPVDDPGLLIASSSPVDHETVVTYGGHTFLVGSAPHTNITIAELEQLGISLGTTTAELVRGFVCDPCSLEEGRELARQMTEADAIRADGSIFFARELDVDPSPTNVIYQRAQVIERGHLASATLAAVLFAAAAVQRLWEVRQPAFRIDMLAGATAGQVWWRAHGLVLVGATLPAAAVVLALHIVLSVFDFSALLPPGQILLVLGPVLALHAIASAYLAARIRGLSASLTRGTSHE